MLCQCTVLPRKRHHALFAAPESSKKNKDDFDIQRVLQSHLWQGVGVSRELTGRKTSGRKPSRPYVLAGAAPIVKKLLGVSREKLKP